MEASKAEEIATSPDELQDLQDDLVIHVRVLRESVHVKTRGKVNIFVPRCENGRRWGRVGRGWGVQAGGRGGGLLAG